MKTIHYAASLLLGVALAPLCAHAQAVSSPQSPPVPDGAQLSEVVVTATKTGAQQLQKTPVAVSVVSGAQLDQQGINNIKDLAKFIPDVTFAQNTASAEIYIRGVGTNNVAAGSDPDVTTQIDGVYIARPSGQFADFLDVERVEILRGPQGTLYGRNAVGGTINVISTTPSKHFEGKVEGVGGDYGLFQGGAYVTGPVLGDKLTGSLAANYQRHDAYFHNIAPGGHDVGEADRGGVKGQLRWEPTVDISATTRADYTRSDEYFESYSNLTARVPIAAPVANSLVGFYDTVALNDPQRLHTRIYGVSEDIDWKLGHGLSLRSITAYRRTRYQFTNDNDATELRIQFSKQQETDDQISQEFDLTYTGDRIKAVAGVYYFHDRDFQGNSVLVPPSVSTPAARAITNAVTPVVRSDSGAVFGQGTYKLTSRLSLTAGVRYTTERKTFDQDFMRTSANPPTFGAIASGFPIIYHLANDYDAFTPKIGLDYQFTDDIFAYASATKGYKSGGFNFSASNPALAAFAPEEIWSYESGLKTQFFDRRLRLNLTGFYYDYSNLQVQQLISAGVQSIGNAASAEVKGLELEAVAKPIPTLQISGNLSWLDAHYNRYPGAAVPAGLLPYVPDAVTVAGVSTDDASGKRLNSAPRYSGAIAIDYTPVIAGHKTFAHVDYAWRTRTYFDPANVVIASQGAYGLLNGQIGFTTGNGWDIELWAKNITNEGYFVTIGTPSLAPAGLTGDPRTMGVKVSRNF